MRALIWQLKPVGLEQGMLHALNHYSELLQLNLTVHVDGLIDVTNVIEENVYRMVQECLNNVRKHAHTKEVTLTLKQTNEKLYVIVQDEGKGFDNEKQMSNTANGLKHLQQRTDILKGQLRIYSKPSKGTRIEIEIPLN